MALLRLSEVDTNSVMFPSHLRVAFYAGCTDAEISAIMRVEQSTIKRWRQEHE